MARPLRFALVGAGAMAQTWAQAFRTAADVDLVAVVDVRRELADLLAEQAGCRSCESVDELLRAGGVDAAVVCTPPASHAEVGVALVEHGVAVLCEKPLAVDLVGARKLLAAAAAEDVILTMASKFRFVEDLVRARSLVASGILGEIVQYRNTFASRVDMRSRWNADPAVAGGGVVIDNGTHSVDIARYLLGPVTEVLAVESRRVQDLPVEDTATLLLRTECGAVGTVELSWAVDKQRDDYVEVDGTEGVLRVGWRTSAFRRHASPTWVDFGNGYDKVVAHARQLENFAAAVRGVGELVVTPEDALASVAVIEAAYRSMETARWVAVASVDPAA
jgi:predicted dehydrogenase